MTARRILLIDGSSLAFRAFYSITDMSGFRNAAGLHTNAIFSFNRMLDSILEQIQPTHVLVAFDQSGPTIRTQLYPEYKGGRDKAPSEFKEQMPYIRRLLDYYGIKYYDMAEYEADDIIGTLAAHADATDEVYIVSGDKDLLQLVSDNTKVCFTRRGVSDLDINTVQTVRETYGIEPQQFIDVKGLMGDSSDNYPGVTGVGEKRALKFIQDYGSIDNLYAHIDELNKSKTKDNLINEEADARLSYQLAKIVTDAPVELSLADTERQPIEQEQLVEFYQLMNFDSFLKKMAVDPSEQAGDQVESFLADYQFVELDTIEPAHLPGQATLYLETLEENYHVADLCGVAWYDPAIKTAYYADPSVFLASEAVADWLADNTQSLTLYDSKRDQVLLHRHGIDIAGIVFDVAIANYLIDTHNSQLLANIVVNQQLPPILQTDESVYGKGAKLAVPEKDILAHHLQTKAIALDLVSDPLTDQLRATQMEELYETMEMPLARVLARMEIQGIRVNGDVLREKNQEMIARLDEIAEEIYQLAGESFNINSPKQLGEILFDQLGLPVIKKTKTGYSTAAGVLEKLIDAHPIIPKILDYRQLAKLQGTYLAGLPDYILADGKIHTRFIQTLTQTGRLSSADPNLQNIPVRLEEGRKIRQAFVPSEPDWQLFGADYSQIELRVLAHISGDAHMRAAFINHEDIHAATARRVFGIPADEPVDGEHRRRAKAVNFGIVYGISDYGLSQNLNIPRKEAQQFIDTYFEKYPDIERYMTEIVEQARQDGYVKTLFNRYRYLPDIKARNFNIRSFAERTAMNSPIQGTAADIIKLAMIHLQAALDREGLQSRLLLQVHDELILEGPTEEMDTLARLVPEVMDHAAKLAVPLEVEYHHGDNWYDLK